MGFSPYGRRLLLSCTFTAGVPPTSLWFGLTATAPGPSDDGTLLDEPVAAEYTRIAYTGGFYETMAGELSTAAQIQFPTPITDWGVLRGWAMCTTADVRGGIVIVSGSLLQPRRATPGAALRFGIDGVRLQLK